MLSQLEGRYSDCPFEHMTLHFFSSVRLKNTRDVDEKFFLMEISVP